MNRIQPDRDKQNVYENSEQSVPVIIFEKAAAKQIYYTSHTFLNSVHSLTYLTFTTTS